MKKILLIVIFTLLSIVLPTLNPVHAGIAAFETVKYGRVVPGVKEDPRVQNLSTKYGFNLEGKIIPLVNLKEMLIAIPDVHPYAVYYAEIAGKGTPRNILDNKIDFTNNNPVSARYCIKTVVIAPVTGKEDPDNYYITDQSLELSEDWVDSRIAGQHEEMLASWNGLWKKPSGPLQDKNTDPDISTLGPSSFAANIYDYNYNYPTHVIGHISPEDCGLKTNPKVPVPSTVLRAIQAVDIINGECHSPHCATFSYYYHGPLMICPTERNPNHVCVGSATVRFEVTRKSVDGHFTNLQAKSGRCNSNDTSDQQTSDLCDARGQWTSGFVPKQVFDLPIIPHAQVEQQIRFTAQDLPKLVSIDKVLTLDTAFKNTHSQMEDTKTATCFATPVSTQDKLLIGEPGSTVSFNQNCRPASAIGTPTPTPGTGGWNCNTNLPEQASAELNAAGKNFADHGIWDTSWSCNTNNAWVPCHNDVMFRAKKSCIDPIFALAIWLHESGASNYKCSEQYRQELGCTGDNCKAQDFGINGAGVPPENFSAQLNFFVSDLNYNCPHTMQDFVSMYYIGNHCYADEPDKEKVDSYVTELQDYYSALGGGTLPSWPRSDTCNQNSL